MTSPAPQFKEQAQALQQLANQLMVKSGALWIDAADKSDTKEGLGIDGRIGLVHSLVDVWVKGYAALLQALLDSQKGSAKPLPAPEPSLPVYLDPKGYDRKLSAETPFIRIGQEATVIPTSCISFKPEILRANDTEFRVLVSDYDYLGSNYTGTVLLTPTAEAAAADKGAQPESEAVTVGL